MKIHGDRTAIAASVDPAWRTDPVYMTPSQLRALIGTLTIALADRRERRQGKAAAGSPSTGSKMIAQAPGLDAR